MVTLYQTEWCPLSAAVREVLTELGVDFVARQVEPWPEQRQELRASPAPTRSPSCRARTAGSTVAPERSSPTYASSNRGSSRPSTAAGSSTIETPASRMRKGSWSSISARPGTRERRR